MFIRCMCVLYFVNAEQLINIFLKYSMIVKSQIPHLNCKSPLGSCMGSKEDRHKTKHMYSSLRSIDFSRIGCVDKKLLALVPQSPYPQSQVSDRLLFSFSFYICLKFLSVCSLLLLCFGFCQPNIINLSDWMGIGS